MRYISRNTGFSISLPSITTRPVSASSNVCTIRRARAISSELGVKTSLSAAKLFKRPVWATLTAGTMKSFHPIGGVSGLIIFSDNDSAGIAAAQDCAAHWRPIQVPVSIQAPTVEGWDYSNALEAFERGEISA